MPVRIQPTALTAKIGARIRDLRLERGMSLADVDAAGGATPGHLSGIERGQVNVTLESLGRIAKALGVDFHELLCDSRPATPATGDNLPPVQLY